MNAESSQQFPPPPRIVTSGFIVNAAFGSITALIGWALVGVGSLFFWLFAANADVSSLLFFRGETAMTSGTITGVAETIFSEGSAQSGHRTHEPGKSIHVHHYQFTGPDGQNYEGVSYSTSTRQPESTVTIEYPIGNPSVSRIVGERRALFPAWVASVGIIPLIGLIIALVAALGGLKALRLLTAGRTTDATLEAKEGPLVYHYKFTADDQQQYTVKKTSLAALGQVEMVLYDPAKPARAAVAAVMPGSPKVDSGKITSSGIPLWRLLIPLAVIAGNAAYVLVKFS